MFLFFLLFPLCSIVLLFFAFCCNFDALSEVQAVHRRKNLIQNFKQKRTSLLQVKTELKNHVRNRFYGILVIALFSWNECLRNADISILTTFLVTFLQLFINIEKSCQILPTLPSFKSIEPFKLKLQREAESALPRPYQSPKARPV